MEIKDLAATLLNKCYTIKTLQGISNEILCIYVDKGAAKLQAVKFEICEDFHMRYFASMWLKVLQNCKKSNLKFARTFNEMLCIHVTKRAAKLQKVVKVRKKMSYVYKTKHFFF